MKALALFYQNPTGFVAALVLLVFSVVSAFIDGKIAIVFAFAFLFVLILDILYVALSYKTTRKYVSLLNKSLSQENVSSVDSFPLPCVICDIKGNAVWFNELFKDEICEGLNRNVNMTDFFPDFKYSKYSALSSANAEHNGKKYTAFISKLKSTTAPMLSVFLFDDTYMKDTEAEFKLSRPFVMLVTVDNIEQLSRQLTDSKFALVLSGIESRIEEWLKTENLLLKKIGNGNFLVVGEKRNLDKISLDKFSVLNEVRQYQFNNTPVNATLSIGVGSGEDFSQCEVRAKKALDMSLGRGGDQAAIYTDNGYIYFGGMSNRAGDNSRVSPRQTAANVSNLIKKYKKVMVLGHKFSDYDAIGAALGIQFFAESYSLPVFIVCDKSTTLSKPLIDLAEDAGYDSFISPAEALQKCGDDTVLFVVDTHRLLLTECPELYEKAGARIIIDHHRRSEDFINDADIFYHLPSPSSTCEMVAELIEYSNIEEKLPSFIATALLSGIVLDTKDYVLRTSQRTFEAAAFLRENDAQTVTVKKLFSVSSDMVNLKNEIINSAVVYDEYMIAKTSAQNENIRVVTSKAADEMLNVEGIKATFVISYSGDELVQISARSLGEENVQLIMEQLGGGGHSTMAACQIKNVDLDTAEKMLIDAIEKYKSTK